MSSEDTTIEIATSFSAFPAGRNDDDGKFNGQRFQTDYLIGPLSAARGNGTKVIISLDGLMSCGSSFLDEAFGGLVRNNHIQRRDLLKVIKVVHSAPHLKRFNDAIFRYINEAKSSR